MIAGEYVLGTLRGRARRRFERLRDRDPEIDAVSRDWERRFASLADEMPETEPPPEVWARIEASIGQPGKIREDVGAGRRVSIWERLGFWRGFGLATAALAACLLAFIAVDRLSPPAGTDFEWAAVLADKQSAATWLVTVADDGRRLSVVPLRQVSIPPDRALELWLVVDAKTPPRSLGLVPARGRRAIELPEGTRKLWSRATVLAMTLEPGGGWVPGTSYGPQLYSGPLKTVVPAQK